LDELTKLRCHRHQTGDTDVFFCPGGHAGRDLRIG
jgi:hypothetical protein